MARIPANSHNAIFALKLHKSDKVRVKSFGYLPCLIAPEAASDPYVVVPLTDKFDYSVDSKTKQAALDAISAVLTDKIKPIRCS
jgi:hypothetical protein